jgi:hypothetical protein
LKEPLLPLPDEVIVPKQYVVFVEDGSCLQTCKNIRLDISEYMKKYYMKPPKNISRLPDHYIKLTKKFLKRAFKELLEACSQKFGGDVTY